MEAVLNANNKELMRMAILKHEETFKQQVNELHRLYQIQKMLMEGVEKSRCRNRNGEEIGFSFRFSHADRKKRESCNEDGETHDGGLERIDESEIELSLGPSRHGKRKNMETGGSFRYNPNPLRLSSSSSSGHILIGSISM